MKIILLEDVKSVGKKGEMVELKDGYARNFIIPKKLGVEATGENMNTLKLQKQNEEKVAKELLEAAQTFAAEIEKMTVKLEIKGGEGGRSGAGGGESSPGGESSESGPGGSGEKGRCR